MRTLIALALCGTLASLAGCVVDGVEAAQARPLAPATEVASGQEVHKMFAEEKARAKAADLPAQF